MAVSKIAVMALVGILAVPILLGYALNLSEVTETDYKQDGDAVDVTPLLKTGVDYTYTRGDPNKLNTQFYQVISDLGNYTGVSAYPHYQSITSNNSTFPLKQLTNTLQTGGTIFARFNSLGETAYFKLMGETNPSLELIFLNNGGGSTGVYTGNFLSVYYDKTTNRATYTYLDNGVITRAEYLPPDDNYAIWIRNSSSQTLDIFESLTQSTPNEFVDLSAGFRFEENDINVKMPRFVKTLLMTINLDSITDPDYKCNFIFGGNFSEFDLIKTTVDGVVNWSVDYHLRTAGGAGYIETVNLYYDHSRTDNTYQLIIDIEKRGEEYNQVAQTMSQAFNIHADFKYVGGWPTLMGASNYYLTYSFDRTTYAVLGTTQLFFDRVAVRDISNNATVKSPIIRFDDAILAGLEYSVISNKDYNPADFKTNPSTTITSINKYGSSIEFAGNTYTVDNTGNITLGTHKVSVNGLKLESIPVPVGYENRINGNVILVTAEPSTIKFNGQWGASVSTIGNTATTYTKTEWIPGEFAWDGIDTNFLIVGLITCLGAFVALGIYVRKSGKGMIPLLIVCGCCAGLFFCMI